MSTIKAVIEKLDGNGLDDALWALRDAGGHDRELRLFAVWCARRVQHLMTDQRSIDALAVAERYAKGQATDEQLAEAADAAEAAAAAARTAAEAAGAAADAAVWASSWAAEAAAEATTRTAACAAWAAAWAAADAAAWASSWAAEAADAAAEAAAASRAVEGAAEIEAQAAELRRVCECIEVGIDPYPREG